MDVSTQDCRLLPGLSCWYYSGSPDFHLPMVGKNMTMADIDFGTGKIPIDTLNLHPGALNERSIVRFTAPVTGKYRLDGYFLMVDTMPTGVTVSVSVNGVAQKQTKVLGSFNDRLPLNGSYQLRKDEYLDFTVDSNGNYFNDSTELQLKVKFDRAR